MSAQTASLVGIPSKTTWSTTATVKLDGGEIFLAAAFSGSEQSPHEGRRFVRMLENISGPDAQSVYLEIEKFLPGLDSGTTLSLALVLKKGDRTALFCYGFGLAGLVRGERGRWLADGAKEKVVLEGDIRPGDLFLLATARARDLPLNLDSFVGHAADDISLLFSRVQSHSRSGEVAILALQNKADRQAEPVEPESKAEPEPIEEKPTPPLPLSPRHLISPDKLAQGIMATEEEKSRRITRTVSKGQLLANLNQILRSRKNLVRVGAAAALLLFLILAMVLYRGAALAKERESVVAPLEQLVSETLALPPEKIGEQRAAVQSLLERLRATRVTYGANQRRVRELLSQVESKNAAISGEKELVNLPVFYDFRLVSSEFLSTKAALEKNQAVFLDGGSGAVLALNIDTKQNETYPREGITNPRDITITGGEAYVLQADKISQSVKTSTQAELLANLPNVQEPLLIDRFGEALYIFDRAGQQLWRLGLEEDATPSGWIRSARGVDFSAITSLAINGSIWFGTSDGSIYQFVRGERQTFAVSGLADPFTSSLYVGVTEAGEKLAVVEPAKKRLVILTKQGEYQLQIESEQIGAVTDVFLSEDEKSAFLTAGSVVYKVDL